MFNIFKQTPTPLRSDEYETLLKRNIDNEQRIRRLELNEEDFRNKVLRKLQDRNGGSDNNIKQGSAVAAMQPAAKRRLGGKSAGLMRTN